MVRWFIDPSQRCVTPSVSLRKLLRDATFIDGHDWEVSGCSADTSTLQPGQVFVAVRGTRRDGHAFVAQALDQGAAGVIVERPSLEAGPLQVVVPNARAAYARICHALAGDPADRLELVGVAGDGEAAGVALFLRSILDAAGQKFGVVGSRDWSDGVATLPVGPGFPEVDGLVAMLSGMLRQKCVGAVVEVSREAIEETALAEGVGFAAAVVPSVRSASREDRDVLNARRRAYARLVRRVQPGGLVVVNGDDPDSEILGAVNLAVDRVSFGIDAPADVRAVVESVEAHAARFRLEADGIDAPVSLRIGGLDSVRHALAAAALAWARGIDVATIVAGLEAIDAVPGQLEPVDEGQPFEVLVDSARSPEALARVLADLRLGRSGRVYCVIGAEGHGDRDERRRLAEAAEAGSDGVVFTSDNPRGEDPRAILDDLLAGVKRPGQARVEPDRRRAIERALAMAARGDAVLIAGKGRNGFQILDDRVVPFDDRAVAARWLRALRDAARRNSA